MIILTSDIDWAPEEVILDMLSLLEKYQVKCTLFCTHDSEAIQNSNKSLFELAIHPNFNPLLQNSSKQTADEIMDEIIRIYPDAKGVRSHSMTQSTPLLGLFKSKGMVYESNHFLPYVKNLEPFFLWNGLFRIPYNWEDDVHFLYEKSYDDLEIDLAESKLNVLDFHPIHVYLNTDSEQTYLEAKKDYQDASKLLEHRNTSNPGARDAFIQLLKTIQAQELTNLTLIEYSQLKIKS